MLLLIIASVRNLADLALCFFYDAFRTIVRGA
jgi:hypothetical protein